MSKKGSLAKKGIKNPMWGKRSRNWKGGRKIDDKGYLLIYKPEHPNVMKGGYVREHRLVMEKYLGRYLEKWELIHHRNGIKSDNRIENLEIVIMKRHFGKVRCPYCSKEFLIE